MSDFQSPLACERKAVEDYRTPRRKATEEAFGTLRQHLECASPLALWEGHISERNDE